jgi:hypothetical protein
VKGILADVDIEGHFRRVRDLLTDPSRAELWAALGITTYRFRDLGLAHDSPDTVVWQRCQQEQLVLLTNNRNDDGPESLVAAIRSANTPDSLPVLTFADADRFLNDRDYANRVVDRLLEYLFDIEKCRGTGRLYLP